MKQDKARPREAKLLGNVAPKIQTGIEINYCPKTQNGFGTMVETSPFRGYVVTKFSFTTKGGDKFTEVLRSKPFKTAYEVEDMVGTNSEAQERKYFFPVQAENQLIDAIETHLIKKHNITFEPK